MTANTSINNQSTPRPPLPPPPAAAAIVNRQLPLPLQQHQHQRVRFVAAAAATATTNRQLLKIQRRSSPCEKRMIRRSARPWVDDDCQPMTTTTTAEEAEVGEMIKRPTVVSNYCADHQQQDSVNNRQRHRRRHTTTISSVHYRQRDDVDDVDDRTKRQNRIIRGEHGPSQGSPTLHPITITAINSIVIGVLMISPVSRQRQ